MNITNEKECVKIMWFKNWFKNFFKSPAHSDWIRYEQFERAIVERTPVSVEPGTGNLIETVKLECGHSIDLSIHRIQVIHCADCEEKEQHND